jgi:hypothetical protein
MLEGESLRNPSPVIGRKITKRLPKFSGAFSTLRPAPFLPFIAFPLVHFLFVITVQGSQHV